MSQVDPEVASAAMYRMLPKRMVYNRWSVAMFRAVIGFAKPPADLTGIDVEQVAVPGSTKDVRVYRQPGDEALPVLLWLHGGGYVLGTNKEDAWGAAFAGTGRMALVSAGYRLAPENPFPAGLDDAHAAVRWVLDHGADHGLDPTRLCIGGESAGGGLAAALVQRLVDEGFDLAGQLLVYPMLDDRTAIRAGVGPKDHLVWTNGSNHYGWSSYLEHEPGIADVAPYAVPSRRDDLSGLPPTWIGVGDLDLFWDEDHAYAERLTDAGVDCHLETATGGPHGFPSFSPDAAISKAFVGSAAAFAERVLG